MKTTNKLDCEMCNAYQVEQVAPTCPEHSMDFEEAYDRFSETAEEFRVAHEYAFLETIAENYGRVT